MRGQGLARDEVREQQSHHWIDVCVTRYAGHRHARQQPYVRGKTEERAGDDEIRERNRRAQRNVGRSAQLTGSLRQYQQHHAAQHHLPTGGEWQ